MNLKAATDQDLKIAIKTVADLVQLGTDLAGGLSFSEIGDLATLAMDIPKVITAKDILWPEYTSLTQEQIAELEVYAAQIVPGKTDVQIFVRKALQVVIAGSAVAQVLIA